MNKIEKWVVGHSVELPEMLLGREARVNRQRTLIERYAVPVVCFTMNIAGPVKVFPLAKKAYYEGVHEIGKAIAARIGEEHCLYMQLLDNQYGFETFYAIDADPIEIKRILTEIEEEHPFGRLFDIDVIKTDGEKVSRPDIGFGQRKCLVCGEDASFCASTRAHTVARLQEETVRLIKTGLSESDVIAARAETALAAEVMTTPKPGLVDQRNCGSHRDMDIRLFLRSADVISGYFGACYETARAHKNEFESNILKYLRPLGIQAEEDMLEATGGVNTHKGMIFSLGILCGAMGYIKEKTGCDLMRTASEIGRPALGDFMNLAEELTHGKSQYARFGLAGIRGEVASGFESVMKIGLPVYRECLERGFSMNDAGVYALLSMIARVHDSNMIARGGRRLADELRKKTGELLAAEPSMEQVEELDDEFIRYNVSPGGCADLLAIIYFLDMEE